ncbi:hypothetical protein Tco_0038502 [Tanacetum coccineum]
MSSMSEDIQCAGSDTRPPMLDRTDFESWQQRIRLYCLGKDNGENIMKSINEGPFHMGTVSDVIAAGTEGAVQQGPVRARVLNDLSAEEKERYKADIRATNILLQGIPKDIYSLINHYTDAKDIWDNVKMILEGYELTKDDKESQLYDDFEHFYQIKGETIHGYYVRVQDGKVVVQDVRGRYNATNQGRPFQRNNARGNGVAGNVGDSVMSDSEESGVTHTEADEEDEDDEMDVEIDEEEHLAPAYPVVVALPATAPSAEETEPGLRLRGQGRGHTPPHPTYRIRLGLSILEPYLYQHGPDSEVARLLAISLPHQQSPLKNSMVFITNTDSFPLSPPSPALTRPPS